MVVKIFASIGVISTFIVAVGIIAVLIAYVEDAAEKLRYRKRLKNRFKGGPIAKCFCKDCRHYSETHKPTKHNHGAGECRAHQGLIVSDCWYCWRASPVEHSEAKRREKLGC